MFMHNTSTLNDMTATVLFDLLYSVWHGIQQRLTLFFDFEFRYHIRIIAFKSLVLVVQSLLRS